jgi:hypothetical protein
LSQIRATSAHTLCATVQSFQMYGPAASL